MLAVVRLNQPEYDARGFADRGIAVHELEFEDCTAPPPAVADAFLRLADAAAGVLAVHCRAGLGRTGTLIALWLMRRRGFGAREAIAWLRIMRPGSVIGEQQHFLLAAELTTLYPTRAPMTRSLSAPAVGEGSRCRDLASQIGGGAERRAAALVRARERVLDGNGGYRYGSEPALDGGVDIGLDHDGHVTYVGLARRGSEPTTHSVDIDRLSLD